MILGCLAADPDRRFQSAGEALQALERSGGSSRSIAMPLQSPRRRFLLAAAGALALASTAAWIEWPRISDLLHPLPAKRFVAVLAWPTDAESPVYSLLQGVLNGITAELARGEAGDRNLLVLSPGDARQATPRTLPEAVTALGANLVLGAALHQEASDYRLDLRVYDSAKGTVLRERRLDVPAAKLGQLSELASAAAARLLGVTLSAAPLREQDELAQLSPAAFQLFQEAADLVGQPNNAGLDKAIEKYQKLLDIEPRFALGYTRSRCPIAQVDGERRPRTRQVGATECRAGAKVQ